MPITNEVLTLSATALAQRIREGSTTSKEVVEAHIARIEEVNPRLNAVVRDRFFAARREAEQADERLRFDGPDRLPALHGVPCTIKESIALTGMPNSCGVVARKDVVADRDAPTVARLRSAGVIPLGVTNVPELTAWMATFNRVYGRTSNAYDATRIAGGSSGGEGSIVGAGASPFGLATDVGGSIRVPSSCNGVFGHKPTGGLVPSSGQFPGYAGASLRFNCTGPIARRAEDLMPLLRILAGPDPTDPQCHAMTLGDPSSVDLGRLRVMVVESDGRRPTVSPELTAATVRAADALRERGATVERRSFAGLANALFAATGLMFEEGHWPIPPDLGRGDGQPVSCLMEVLRLAAGRSEHIAPVVLSAFLRRPVLSCRGWIRRQATAARALRAEIEDALGNDGVMLYPIAIDVAPRHGVESIQYFRFAGLFNVLEMPSTQTPLGLGREGLPLGVQVIGGRGQDHLTIAVALALERALGGWVPPRD
ncbi:MAG: amidase [Proteobacteria bacterium]|nr:amidase [Pseudomonadota bacterium]